MKKAFKIILLVFTILVLLAGSFLTYVNIDSGKLKDLAYLEGRLDTLSPGTLRVEGIKPYVQPDAYTCGVTTQSVVASFIEKKDLTPRLMMEKYNLKGGMKTSDFTDVLSRELTDYNVTCKQGLSDFDLICEIHRQLKENLPVPVFFGAQNPYDKPHYDFHASVVTGIDLDKQTIDIFNVYGYKEHISLVEFLNRMSYRGTKDYPFVQRAVIKLGLMEKNSIVLIEKKQV